MQQDLKLLKITKVCATRWLTHGESCIRVIVRFEPGDAEAEGVRDQLLQPEIICMSFIAPCRSFISNHHLLQISSN